MTSREIMIAVAIHLVTPILGILLFLHLRNKIKEENNENPPLKELFIIFITYGGLLLLILTSLFWKWSGMASLGTFYLVLVAPIIMGVIAYRRRHNVSKSKSCSLIHKLALSYFAIAPATFLILFFVSKN